MYHELFISFIILKNQIKILYLFFKTFIIINSDIITLNYFFIYNSIISII